ncbi:hypothetical protein [Spirosoma endophyticum]|uniref:Uncharacterized protein n=1 Tax=Spirosoma endophyticum TaxID=662367 RepID=A0A1I2I4J6_9BACT|nr:hypothetical protein [Spirosoma endophyticum]SFF36553.1 hypothetical protein SAMN05216167_15517 [Spirosoma endophyticum]
MSVSPRLKSRFILLVPAYWACLFDEIITITHQSKEYWEGNLKAANEGNPFGAFLMANYVSGIFLISVVWLIIIGIIGYYVSHKLLKIFVLFVLLAHTWGASSWLSPHYGFWSVMAFILFNSVLFVKIEEYYLSTYNVFSWIEK